CRITADVLDAEVSYTLMLREEENAFVPVAGCGETPDRWQIVRAIKIPCAAVEEHEGGAARPQPAAGATDESLVAELRAAYDLRALLSVALRRGDQIIGFQVAGRRRAAPAFSARQQRVARGIAQLASLALENARLVDKLEQANRLKSDF